MTCGSGSQRGGRRAQGLVQTFTVRPRRSPLLDFRSIPAGIDVIKVVERGILSLIDTDVAHRKPGTGQVGMGVLLAPAKPLVKAYKGPAAMIWNKVRL